MENWWIDRVREFFSSKPFKLSVDRSKSLRSEIRALIAQAEKRQKELSGTMVAGAVMQHLVGAKLQTLLPHANLKHHGFSVADESTGRTGDFDIGDCVIHVTTTPTEALITKCNSNLEADAVPMIISTRDGCVSAENLAKGTGIGDRIEIIEIEQFLATNIHERSGFQFGERRPKIEEIVNEYNRIVEECETDPSLRIEVA